jgi:hypothetical protein
MTEVTEKKEAKPLTPSQNAFMALEQMRANMAHQVDMHKFNLLSFGYAYLLQFIDELCKKEMAADAELNNSCSQATPSEATAAAIIPPPSGQPTESPSIL